MAEEKVQTREFTAIEIETTFSRRRKNEDSFEDCRWRYVPDQQNTYDKVVATKVTPSPSRRTLSQCHQGQKKMPARMMFRRCTHGHLVKEAATKVGHWKKEVVETETEFRAAKAKIDLKKFKEAWGM